MSFFSLFGGDVVDTIGEVAKEWIETDKESAEAKSIFVKTLDPNGKMRKQISKDVTQMYKVYIYLSLLLLLAQASGLGNQEAIALAVSNVTGLFLPITAMFSGIVGASFGVNAMNTYKGI